jgi:3'-phosphoadenosine 5'-phosphosulfate sulfotransferase (PAPS reductase)/FAD synthetase
MTKVRHVLGISGGKDSAALAIYMKLKYPDLPIEYYNADTGKELKETYDLLSKLEGFLGHIEPLKAAKGTTEATPFDHFLKLYNNFLPSTQARWCTEKMKLSEFETYVGKDLAISYVGIRGDEDREGYVSTRTNIQTIFPFRRNIWSLDVINKVLGNENISFLLKFYNQNAKNNNIEDILEIIERPLTKAFYYSKKINALLDFDVKLFNRAVFEFLKTTDYPIGKLDSFPLIENDDIIGLEDVKKILIDSNVGIPAYYNEIEFEVDGRKGTYARSRSGCFFCFYQQKIEWIWLYEQHPDLFKQAMEYEKSGYTWNDNERLSDLIKPERVKQIKIDYLKRLELKKKKFKSNFLIDILEEDKVNCANCFI